MFSTGNDIVALKAINIARTKQPNFYKKILSVSEIKLYDQQFSGKMLLENFVWLLWSVKESAYKYLQRITPELVFSPTRTIVSKLEFPLGDTPAKLEGSDFDKEMVYKGIVSFEDHTLYSRSIINEEFIFSVVNHEDDFKGTHWGIQLISSSEPEVQSSAVRTFLSIRLSTLFPNEDLQISKNPHGYPVLIKDGVEFPVVVSLAHHDRYVAYSMQRKYG
jgi:phosphopantetheinyl transferase (holo-ACP synthase)